MRDWVRVEDREGLAGWGKHCGLKAVVMHLHDLEVLIALVTRPLAKLNHVSIPASRDDQNFLAS